MRVVEVLVPSLHLPEIGNKRIVLIRLERILRTQLNIQTILQERLLKREVRFIVTTDAKFRCLVLTKVDSTNFFYEFRRK